MCVGPGEAPAHAGDGTLASAPAGIIRATPKGRFVLNAVVAEISKSFVSVANGVRPLAQDAGVD